MTDQTAVLWVRITPPEGRLADVLAMLRSLVGPAEAHPSCVRCSVERSPEYPEAVTIRYEWSNQTDLLRYVRNHDRRVLIEAVDLSSKVPEIRLATVSVILQGIEVLADMDDG